MLARTLMIFAVMVLVSACSTTDEEATVGGQTTAQHDGLSDGPLSDIYDPSAMDGSAGGPAPGTQADLVVNVGDRVFFGTDRYDVDNEARLVLERQANFLAQYPNLNISIEGHADERGTREYNLALGARRAEAAKNYLIALGVDPRRVDTISFGKERPEALGANANAWAQNRRSVSVIK